MSMIKRNFRLWILPILLASVIYAALRVAPYYLSGVGSENPSDLFELDARLSWTKGVPFFVVDLRNKTNHSLRVNLSRDIFEGVFVFVSEERSETRGMDKFAHGRSLASEVELEELKMAAGQKVRWQVSIRDLALLDSKNKRNNNYVEFRIELPKLMVIPPWAPPWKTFYEGQYALTSENNGLPPAFEIKGPE
jgi:hypothetical protein